MVINKKFGPLGTTRNIKINFKDSSVINLWKVEFWQIQAKEIQSDASSEEHVSSSCTTSIATKTPEPTDWKRRNGWGENRIFRRGRRRKTKERMGRKQNIPTRASSCRSYAGLGSDSGWLKVGIGGKRQNPLIENEICPFFSLSCVVCDLVKMRNFCSGQRMKFYQT